MEKTKLFYSRTTEVWQGSQFEENEYVTYYENKDIATGAFEREQKNVYDTFNEYYDSAEIIVTDGYMSDGERVCRITAKNGDDSDVCAIRLKELKMICDYE
jgi:hypothetical protein